MRFLKRLSRFLRRKKEEVVKKKLPLTSDPRKLGLLLALPAVIITVIVLLYPLAIALYESFFGGFVIGRHSFVGLENYIKVFTDSVWRSSIFFHFLFFVCALGGEVVIGLGIALLLNRKFLGRGVIRTIFVVPFMVAPTVIALMWIWILEPSIGIANYILGFTLGLQPKWLGEVVTARFSIIFVWIWAKAPWDALVFMAALTGLPKEPYDAAKVDGASRWQIFRHLTLPDLKPAFAVLFLLRGIMLVREFDIPFVLTRGGPARSTEIMSTWAYKVFFKFGQMGKGYAMGIINTIICVAIIAVIYYTTRKWGQE